MYSMHVPSISHFSQSKAPTLASYTTCTVCMSPQYHVLVKAKAKPSPYLS